MTLSASSLYNLALGQHNEAGERCYLCGGPCGRKIPRLPVQNAVVTKRQLTDADIAAGRPATGTRFDVVGVVAGGAYCCNGCRMMVRESVTVETPTQREYGMPVRAFSWLITDNSLMAYRVPQHKVELMCVVLSGKNKTPWAIILSDMQVDFMYRTPVNESNELPLTLTLNGDKITYEPDAVRKYIDIAHALEVATLEIPKGSNDHEKYAILCKSLGKQFIEDYMALREDPIMKLAAWLCPGPSQWPATEVTEKPTVNPAEKETKKPAKKKAPARKAAASKPEDEIPHF